MLSITDIIQLAKIVLQSSGHQENQRQKEYVLNTLLAVAHADIYQQWQSNYLSRLWLWYWMRDIPVSAAEVATAENNMKYFYSRFHPEFIATAISCYENAEQYLTGLKNSNQHRLLRTELLPYLTSSMAEQWALQILDAGQENISPWYCEMLCLAAKQGAVKAINELENLINIHPKLFSYLEKTLNAGEEWSLPLLLKLYDQRLPAAITYMTQITKEIENIHNYSTVDSEKLRRLYNDPQSGGIWLLLRNILETADPRENLPLIFCIRLINGIEPQQRLNVLRQLLEKNNPLKNILNPQFEYIIQQITKSDEDAINHFLQQHYHAMEHRISPPRHTVHNEEDQIAIPSSDIIRESRSELA